MKCPRCDTELPDSTPAHAEPADPPRSVPTPEDALCADAPPAPCPQCGWSTMWNE